jgi:AcrR family transcriptional regulator
VSTTDQRSRPSQRLWQRQQTEAAIQRAALAIFLERGYEDATADQVAAAADVSVRTFFRYFPRGKDDVMLLEARRPIEALREALAERPLGESPLLALRRALAQVIEDEVEPSEAAVLYGQMAMEHPDLLARMMGERQLAAEAIVPELAKRMGVDPGLDHRPRLLAHVLHAASTTAWLCWLARPNAESYRSMLDGMLRELGPAFAAKKDGDDLGAARPSLKTRR